MSRVLFKASSHRILAISVCAIVISCIFTSEHCESVTRESEGQEEEQEEDKRERQR